MSLIDVEVEDGVALFTLNDPERRNALNMPMVEEIVAAYDDIEARDDVNAVIVTGAAPAFCAGADLSHLGSSQRQGLLSVYDGFMRFARSKLPTIAAVNGAAVGAGMNLALACDVRIAARRAKFDTRFMQLGLHPGGGHTWMFRRITGPQAVSATVLFGEVLDGAEAERIGLVWRCVDDDALLDTARAMAARAAAAPRELLIKTKESIAAMATIEDHDEAVERELEPQLWSVAQPAFKERLAALQAKISKSK